MDLNKIKKKISKLEKTRSIIEFSKIFAFQKLNISEKISRKYFDVALLSKKMIEFTKDKYKVFYKIPKNKGKIWIYISIKSLFFSEKLKKMQKYFLENFDRKKDLLVGIGEDMESFCKKNDIQPIFISKTFNDQALAITSIIKNVFYQEKISKVIFFLNNQFLSNKKYITIFPIEENDLNLHLKNEEHIIDQKYSFFPSLIHSLNALIDHYFFHIINGFIKQSEYDYYKQKFIEYQEWIKNIDEVIEKIQIQIHRKVNKIEDEALNDMIKIFKLKQIEKESEKK